MVVIYAPINLGTIATGSGGFVIHGEDAGDFSGESVASAGDVNGDGFDDLIIGAPWADGAGNAKYNGGGSYLVFGRTDGFGAAIDLARIAAGSGGFVIYGEDADDRSGLPVRSAGDVNGDGFDDLVIGARNADGPGIAKFGAGGSYVVFGKTGGFGAAIDLASIAAGAGGFVIHGEDSGDKSGWSVASAGDVNGDGFDDLIIGARYADGAGNAKPFAGDSYVVFGKVGGFAAAIDLSTIAAGIGGFVIHGEDSNDQFGYSVASAGDVNGDGFDDLIIGAVAADGVGNAKSGAGSSYVVFGKTSGFGGTINFGTIAAASGGFLIHGENRRDYSGWSVASAGDVNGDGFDDLIIGASGADGAGNAESGAGGSYVVFGKSSDFPAAINLSTIAAGTGGFVIHGEDPGDSSGWSVASAGDVNGDGFDDLIIGALQADGAGNAKRGAGGSYLIFGKAGGFGAAIDLATIAAGTGGFVIHGEDLDDYSGMSVASAGDVNGDGFDDLIVGAPWADGADNARLQAGDSYVVLGGSFQPGPTGTAGVDMLIGDLSAEGLQGLDGADILKGKAGRDSLSGGAGDDRLRGGHDGDVLSGGEGADRFQFGDRSLGAIDRILDLDAAEGDRIYLRGIDAIAGTMEDDAFFIIGTAAFSHTAGELRWQDRGHGVQRIEGDVDGDGDADLLIDIANDAAPIDGAWFVL